MWWCWVLTRLWVSIAKRGRYWLGLHANDLLEVLGHRRQLLRAHGTWLTTWLNTVAIMVASMSCFSLSSGVTSAPFVIFGGTGGGGMLAGTAGGPFAVGACCCCCDGIVVCVTWGPVDASGVTCGPAAGGIVVCMTWSPAVASGVTCGPAAGGIVVCMTWGPADASGVTCGPAVAAGCRGKKKVDGVGLGMTWAPADASGVTCGPAAGAGCCGTLVDGVGLGMTAACVTCGPVGAGCCGTWLVDGITLCMTWVPADAAGVTACGPGTGVGCCGTWVGDVCDTWVDGAVLCMTCWGGACVTADCCGRLVGGIVLCMTCVPDAFGVTAPGPGPVTCSGRSAAGAVLLECAGDGVGVLGDVLAVPSKVRGDLHALHRSPSASTSAGW